jgi:hypothetical protein
VALGPAIPTGTQTFDTSAKLGGVDHATVTVDAGASNITMQGNSSIGDDLFRAHIEFSGRKPNVDSSSGDVHISEANTSGLFFRSHRFVLDLQLNASISWTIVVNSGASSDTFNLSGVDLDSIELNTGASRETITVGTPSNTVPITVNGGALTVDVHRPHGIAASAAVSGGAVSLSFDGRQHHAVGNLNDQTSDNDSATNRYQIEVNGGACNVTVDESAPSG